MKKFALTLAAAALAFAALRADNYSDFAAYKPGDSLAWFYQLRSKSLMKPNAKGVEARLLEIIGSRKISDAAFDRACEILKPIATKKSIPVLAEFLNDEFRAPWVCGVFVTIESSRVEDALVEKLPSLGAKCAMDVISTLAERGDSSSVEAVAKFADSENGKLAEFAVCALAKFADSGAVDALSSIAKRGDFRQKAAFEGLSDLAYSAAKSGDVRLAKAALEAVPADFPMSIAARALVAKNRMAYLDSILIADGKRVAEAGRLVYNGRKFEDSEKIIKAFPKLSKRGKLAAMSGFMLSGDTRFYPTIAPLLDSSDPDLKIEAVYSARYICTDEENLRKIYPLMTCSNRILAQQARRVFEENPSFAAAKVLKAAAAGGDLLALEILVNRGDVDARAQMWKKFLDGGYKDADLARAFENSVVVGELPALAKHLKGGDNALREAIMKIVIRKIAKTRDKLYMGGAAYEVLNGNIDPSDRLYKLAESKLKCKIAPNPQVWQSEYRLRAVEDSKMKAAEGAEPDLKEGFVPMFDGKTLSGWKTSTGNAKYSVKDGCIMGVTDPAMKQNSFLITERADYKDFVFTCEFKWLVPGNSGVIFKGYFNESGKVVGPQAEMDNDRKRRWTGGVYFEGSRWMYSLSRRDQEAARNAVDLDGWNRMTIKCQGDRMQTWVNGVPVADLEWQGVKPGFFGLQVHQGKEGTILWRDIKIKELK